MFNFFYKSKCNLIVVFVIYNDQLIAKKNVIVTNNKFLKTFIYFNSNFHIVRSFHIVHQFI